MYAVDGNYEDIVSLLLEHGADVSIKDQVCLLSQFVYDRIKKYPFWIRWDSMHFIIVDLNLSVKF